MEDWGSMVQSRVDVRQESWRVASKRASAAAFRV